MPAQQQSPIPGFYTQAEVARLFGVDIRTVWRWRTQGLVSARRLGNGRWVHPVDQIDAMLAAETTAGPEART